MKKTLFAIIFIMTAGLLLTAGITLFPQGKKAQSPPPPGGKIVGQIVQPEQWQLFWAKGSKTGQSGLMSIRCEGNTIHFIDPKGGWIVLNRQPDGSYAGQWKDPQGATGVIVDLKFLSPFCAEGTSIGKEGDNAAIKLLRMK